MKLQTLSRSLIAAAALLPAAAFAQECALPGALVLEDAAGDAGLKPVDAAPVAVDDPVGRIPVPIAEADILSLHIGESGGKLVFTYRIASLAEPLESAGYILRMTTDTPPENGDEDYFVAMLTSAEGAVSFVHGTTGANQDAGTGPRFFNVAGDLDAASNYAADGTITLVLDPALIGAPAGSEIYNLLASVRVVAPTTEDTGMTANGSNATILDDVPGDPGYYDVGSGGCADGRGLASGDGLAVGAFGLPATLLLGLAAAFGIRRRR